MASILFQKESGVATITFSRPDKYNSFTREMALAFQEALDECRDDLEIRCIIITGEGKAFCAGQDLNEAINPEEPDIQTIVAEHYNPIIQRLRRLEKPIIAAVNGAAAGAGANIALACDLVVAKDSAYFLQAFCHIGLIPDSGGTYYLPRLIGLQRTAALTMLGEKLYAPEAEKIGLIYKSLHDDEFESEIKRISIKLAQMPTKGIGLIKRALNYSLVNDLSKQLSIEEQLQFAASQTEDYEEGVKAFLEKRKAVFQGK